jgi:hypothetical protein
MHVLGIGVWAWRDGSLNRSLKDGRRFVTGDASDQVCPDRGWAVASLARARMKSMREISSSTTVSTTAVVSRSPSKMPSPGPPLTVTTRISCASVVSCAMPCRKRATLTAPRSACELPTPLRRRR